MSQAPSITLSEFTRRISAAVNSTPSLSGVWVVAETSDVRSSGGHCYLELVEKDEHGIQKAKIRAIIWQSVYYRLAARFRMATGMDFRSDIKVMVLVTATYHPVYGMSANITDIDCAYTMGDLLRRRNEMIQRLTQEGVINDNKDLEFPMVPQRIAVISAHKAAGYGDFMEHLHTNRYHIRFYTKLYAAVVQGEGAPSSIIAALDAINENIDDFDAVVIIRGGGSTTDLLAFEDYNLAYNIACFPLPVIIGIGHERDITLLDYVAKMRVKTPTAAADFLIGCGMRLLGVLQTLANDIVQGARQRVSGCRQQLAMYSGILPSATIAAIERSRRRITNARITLASVSDRRIRPAIDRLDFTARTLATATANALAREHRRLDATARLIDALSPEATLRRGYSITRVGGHAITDPSQASPGTAVETILAHGTLVSTVTSLEIKQQQDQNTDQQHIDSTNRSSR